jgi:acyl carrier protein
MLVAGHYSRDAGGGSGARRGAVRSLLGGLFAKGEPVVCLSATSAEIGQEAGPSRLGVAQINASNSKSRSSSACVSLGNSKGDWDMFDEVEEQLRQILSDNMKIDKNLVQKGSKLEDWGGDSLQFLETVFEIETHFGISFPDMQNEKISDFDGLVRIVKTAIEASKNETP